VVGLQRRLPASAYRPSAYRRENFLWSVLGHGNFLDALGVNLKVDMSHSFILFFSKPDIESPR